MSRVPHPIEPHRFIDPVQVVELVHHHTGHRGASIIGVDSTSDVIDLYVSEIPSGFEHPADALLGLRAPRNWSVCGLSVPIRAHRLDADEAHEVGATEDGEEPATCTFDGCAEVESDKRLADASRLTLIVDRHGRTASLFDGSDMDPVIVDEPPEGWVLDLLRRTVGVATAPPEESLAEFVEAAWLDALVAEMVAEPSTTSDWSRLALLHPLHPPGPVLPGPLIAVETQALELESDWGRMRRLWASSATTRGGVVRPPGTGPSYADDDLAHWFDDGSFARWISRTVPPPAQLLDLVLTLVPAEVGSELVDALVSVTPVDTSPE